MDAHVITRVLWLRRQFRRRDGWTRQQLEWHQARALDRLREYTYARSPFYQRFHQGLTNRPLQELPVLTKHLLMEHFDEVITDRTVRLRAARSPCIPTCSTTSWTSCPRAAGRSCNSLMD